MNKNVINSTLWLRMVWMLVCMMGILPLAAQDDFRPDNPPEPNTVYRIRVSITPDGAGYVSGEGKYTEGTSVYLHTSSYTGFEFKHWLRNGEVYSTDMYLNYTVERMDVDFVAVYEYKPSSPDEPSMFLKYPLWLKCYPEKACSFNRTNGERTLAGEWTWLYAYANQGFEFQGWYDASGNLVSENIDFNYEMPYEETTLTARYVYNPASPGDPAGGNQENVDNGLTGDVDGDKTVDVTDAVAVINAFLGGSTDSGYDVNKDSTVDVTDAVEVINIYLKAE